jgi:ubiquinone/menaquinone biosynthesis C-methylase UbiE
MKSGPAHILSTANAFQRSQALKTGVELGIFSAIADGATDPRTIARRTATSERGVRILCDYLVVLHLLEKEGGMYRLTDDAKRYLDPKSEDYCGDALPFLLSPMMVEGFSRLTDAVRTGRTALPPDGSMAPHHPAWVHFAHGMKGVMRVTAEAVAELLDLPTDRPSRVLDIAAGHGLFGVAVAKRVPTAHIVAVDWPEVLEVAAATARAAGVEDRFTRCAGSAFAVDFGSDFDTVLIPNFLHHLSLDECELLLRKVHGCLKPHGTVISVGFIPDETRTTPAEAAAFALTMLATTEQGDAYTAQELIPIFSRAGFPKNALREIVRSASRVIISRRE